MKKRAVAYCRVSTDHSDQLNSLENQRRHWEEHIKNRDDMIFSGLYVDEGISGTETFKRHDFNRMIRDAEEGKFDLIFTKEVSRFARNTVDALKYTRHLIDKGVGVIFQEDNINTLDNDGELRLSLMATLAQEESRKISQRVKWGHRRAMKSGIVFGSNRILGYDLVDKKLVVNKNEEKIVKKIFQWYIDGESLHGIVRRLEDEGITKGKLGGKINHTSIRRILTNEKYCGDLKQQKYYTTNYLTHKRKVNKGHQEYVIIEDNHEAIIDRKIWNEVQKKIQHNKKQLKEKGIGYSRNVWGGKVLCDFCGDKFRRKKYKNTDGTDRIVWVCTTSYNKGRKVCENGSYIREDILETIIMEVFNRIADSDSQKEILENLNKILENSLTNGNLEKEIESIKKQIHKIKDKKDRLLELFLEGDNGISKDDLIAKRNDLNKSEDRLNETLEKLGQQQNYLLNKKKRLEKMLQTLNKIFTFNVFNETLVESFVDKIVVGKDKVTVYLIYTAYDIHLSKYPSRVDTRDNTPR